MSQVGVDDIMDWVNVVQKKCNASPGQIDAIKDALIACYENPDGSRSKVFRAQFVKLYNDPPNKDTPDDVSLALTIIWALGRIAGQMHSRSYHAADIKRQVRRYAALVGAFVKDLELIEAAIDKCYAEKNKKNKNKLLQRHWDHFIAFFKAAVGPGNEADNHKEIWGALLELAHRVASV